MAEFRRILMVLFLILMIHFTANQQFSYITVRDGDDVTLPCENVINGQEKCDRTEWSFDHVDLRSAKLLFRHGQIETSQIPNSKSDRLSVTEKCSLVMKKVTNNDVGRYYCNQQQGEAAYVQLSVVTMNEHKSGNQDILSCTVWTYQNCGHTIKWLVDQKPIEENNSNMQPSQLDCYSTLTVLDSHFIHTSNNYSSLKCEVTDTNSGKVQLFPFRLQSSASTNPTSSTETTLKSSTGTTANDGDVDTKTATTKSTEYTTESSTNQGGSTGTSDAATKLQGLLRLIIVSVGLTALILIVVTVEVWSRTKVLGPPDAVHGQTTADGKDCRPE
ncbi:uncharacterized protein [Channa argus]|uniref:uncharacterized protein isoform X2 n=1 Tax=Channa argus TaxID=215402 RepID=UPI003521805F